MALVGLLVGAGCSTTDDATTTEPPMSADAGSPEGAVVADLGVDLGGVAVGDVFEPAAVGTDPTPIVVMLHGTAGDRSRMHALARRVAAEGVLVYVPSWPVIDQALEYPSDTDEPYRRQSEVAVCALRHIRRTALERGGDPDDLTVFGHSGGAMLGAQVAMVSEPPWPGIDCLPETSHAPQRFIGSAGDYNGIYQLSQRAPDFYAPFDPTSIEPSNDDLEVRLLHGLVDHTVGPGESSEFLAHTVSYGLDAEMITTDSGHGAMIDPETPAGEFVAEQIVALVTGVSSAFDLTADDARMRLDKSGIADVCVFDGPSTFQLDRPLDIGFETPDDRLMALLGFSIRNTAPVTDEEILAYEGTPLTDPPDFVDLYGMQRIYQPRSETIRLLFLESDQRWVLACLPVEPPGSETPMIPRLAVVISPDG